MFQSCRCWGQDSPKLGLGLWRHLTVAWCVEGSLAFAGVWLYLRAKKLTLARKVVLISVMALVMVVTIFGQTRQTSPPTLMQMAGSSLITITLLVWLGFWIDRRTKVEDTLKP